MSNLHNHMTEQDEIITAWEAKDVGSVPKTTELKIYMITASNEDDEDLDLLVQASTPVAALEMWRDHYCFEEDKIATWDGPFVLGIPIGPFQNYREVARVFEVQPVKGVAGPLKWSHGNSHSTTGRTLLVGHVRYIS